jgi:hypothetical protein
MEDLLKIGDTVLWSGSWGSKPYVETKVTSIEVNCVNKHGADANEVEWDKVVDKSVMVTLENGHWAYGYQIKPLNE